jgi:hypothetical protein
MRKSVLFLPLLLFLGASICGKKAEEEKIIVIIQEEPPEDTTVSDTVEVKDTAHHVVDTIVDTVVLVDTVAAKPDTLMQTKGGVRTMSLTGAVVLLEHDLSRGDAKRMLRHIDALGDAVTGELERIEAAETSKDKPGVIEVEKEGGNRKRTLNLFLLKLWSLKRSVKEFEEKGIPREEREKIRPVIEELDSLARRIEGKA